MRRGRVYSYLTKNFLIIYATFYVNEGVMYVLLRVCGRLNFYGCVNSNE